MHPGTIEHTPFAHVASPINIIWIFFFKKYQCNTATDKEPLLLQPCQSDRHGSKFAALYLQLVTSLFMRPQVFNSYSINQWYVLLSEFHMNCLPPAF